MHTRQQPFVIALFVGLVCSHSRSAEIQYSRDVRPILARNCFACHGPDAKARQGDLRLDLAKHALAKRDSGAAVIPGQANDSQLIKRITSDDPDTQMPPADSDKKLTAREVGVLKTWISQGARYETHWAFTPPERPALPSIRSNWIRTPIDAFVLQRLRQADLAPSRAASKEQLLRRVTLDLTGLAPTASDREQFLNDRRPDAYERLVDRLLASPAYGEHMSVRWLDLSRYADSGGYQGDILRSMWMWRDWVIRALNRGQPFDEFTRDQLAGDLIPLRTQEQLIATGFHRNHRINDEDGIILEEFRVEYVADRVNTTGTVWMGLTLGCARCHDHKYDPLTQREYYQLFAYFNSIDEKGRGNGNSPPLLRFPTDAQTRRLDQIESRIKSVDISTAAGKKTAATLKKERDRLLKATASTMVMRELPTPRETRVLIRGAYDRPGERVNPALPTFIRAGQQPQSVRTRLQFADWLTNGRHPLTARVAVNRYWQHFFGRGIVATPEDFGTQGALPTHPRLLDWLATEFVRSGWDVKAMHRLIVASSVYRQDSAISGAAGSRDPQNLLWSRAPRIRMTGEMVRDQALSASGLLVRQMGGRSVRPYQPPGLWRELASASSIYQPEQGSNLYRRTMYTFWRRTIPPPQLILFDAPNRELCTARRPRTSTPLQSLVLMNAPAYVEASRHLADDLLARELSPEERLVEAFRALVVRRPSSSELRLLTATWEHFRRRYSNDLEAAREYVGVGYSKPRSTQVAELAALTATVSMIMNLDEAVTRE